MKKSKTVELILMLIPVIGVGFIITTVTCLILFIWGYNPLLNVRIMMSSVIIIIILRMIEKAISNL